MERSKEFKKLINQYRKFFGNKGYNVEDSGVKYYGSLLHEVRELVASDISDEEIKEALPCYYLEEYRHFFEIPRGYYFGMLNEFYNSRPKKDGEDDMSLEDSLIYYAKIFNAQEKETDIHKTNVKTPVAATTVKPE